MAHIIALQGPSNSGKTSTLIQVFKGLQDRYPAATVRELASGIIDVKVIMYDINGKVVGIESQGDPGSRLQQSLADFLAEQCDIIYCACRTRGMTVEWVNALSSKHQVQLVPKARSTDNFANENSITATSLINLAGL